MLPPGGHHPGAGKRPRPGRSVQTRAHVAQGAPDGGQPVRPWRQGHADRYAPHGPKPAGETRMSRLQTPFADPMADGPAIQLANIRALDGGQNLAKTLQMVREFRQGEQSTPLVLMGYFNPIHKYGVARFIAEAKESGVDGLIVVDLQPEHNVDLCDPAQAAGLDFIRLTTPTTDDARLPKVLNGSSGFVY